VVKDEEGKMMQDEDNRGVGRRKLFIGSRFTSDSLFMHCR
jgi:hypothetical protein